MSTDSGVQVRDLSIDHVPSESNELKRITSNGGRVYQTLVIDNQHTY